MVRELIYFSISLATNEIKKETEVEESQSRKKSDELLSLDGNFRIFRALGWIDIFIN